jgi:peptidoglycan/xylan/chitin deacetylase (PgdA/CDA1 family)
MKTAVKAIIGQAARVPLVRDITRRKLIKCTNVIYYHFFGEPKCFSDEYEDCSIEKFESDLRLIKKHFDFVPLATVLDNHLSGREPDRPQIALTFDDGFDMFRNGIVDVLARHSIKATSFLITGCIDNNHLMWINKLNAIAAMRPDSCRTKYDSLMQKVGLPPANDDGIKKTAMRTWPMRKKEELVNELWQMCHMPAVHDFLDEHRPYFSWKEIEEWMELGHSIGLHTHTHPKCEDLDEAMTEQEIRAPARLLKQKFQLRHLVLAYPFGSRLGSALEKKLYDERVFDFAFGIRGFSPKTTEPYRMERVNGEDRLGFNLFGKPLLVTPG